MNYNDSEILFIDSEDWKTQAVMAIQTINLGTGVDMVLLISSFLEVWRGSTCVTRYTGLPVLILNLEMILNWILNWFTLGKLKDVNGYVQMSVSSQEI